MKRCRCTQANCTLRGVRFPYGCELPFTEIGKGTFLLFVNGKPVGPFPAKTFLQYFNIIKK